ncbi:xylose isomerase [Roseomonas marmotae]|uniref:Xylose isomerase n=1 Tax=Roseomonas marmotae TaxID=2768161 RepID=A0ABS3KCJ4_9PROT|nr:xylose isomerase [Roseomonas marmotae]MBO1075191.1 xylose isomerase [Roseomonas marmotae]QTI79700.1 xylose isomerase [Roseomonas marmotae]
MSTIFDRLPHIRYAGPEATDPFALRYYDAKRVVLGRSMEDWLRPAVAYWHSFVGNGLDPFGAPTHQRPWFSGDPVQAAHQKAEAAFVFLEKLGLPFFCFHDRDVAPEGGTLRESNALLDRVLETVQAQMQRTGIRLLWGTANLFSHPRYMAGAATNPDPEVFAYAAGQVKHVLEATHRLGGANYVLWGGREGYDTLLNTDLRQEDAQLGRFLNLVVEHKHRIGFPGTILIEPKPMEPTKHQYDRDVATVYGFLSRHGLLGEVKLNIEANHATLAGHSFEHEIATAAALGILGSLDMNRGDPQNGWDTDQFPNNAQDLSLAMLEVVRAGGLGQGGVNFDAKIRRQSIDPEDLLHAHVGGIDTTARALLIAERILRDGGLERAREERYAGWKSGFGQQVMQGQVSLEALAEHAATHPPPQPRSGRQEALENIAARFA